MAKKETIFIPIKDATVPLDIITENRISVRIGIGRRGASLRMPRLINFTMRSIQIAKATEWVRLKVENDHRLYQRFYVKSYKSGDTVIYYGQEYELIIKETTASIQKASCKNRLITLQIDSSLNKYDKQKLIQNLLSRILSKVVKSEFSALVHSLNAKYFKKEINSIRLKYNKSNWGSCSGKNNLNFSTRLLFAPIEVIEYVIIHELAHLIEMNHSSRFWDVVKSACPNYDQQEKWLKNHGQTCDF